MVVSSITWTLFPFNFGRFTLTSQIQSIGVRVVSPFSVDLVTHTSNMAPVRFPRVQTSMTEKEGKSSKQARASKKPKADILPAIDGKRFVNWTKMTSNSLFGSTKGSWNGFKQELCTGTCSSCFGKSYVIRNGNSYAIQMLAWQVCLSDIILMSIS